MSVFDQRRLSNATLQLDIERIRRGFYADKYFENVARVLQTLSEKDYRFQGRSHYNAAGMPTGDIVVEAQYFNRRVPYALVAGVDVALAMLRYGTGYFDREHFTETWDQLEVEAVEDGVFTHYAGDPMQVEPVIRVRGRYRDFALLETTMLGVLSRATRLATNVYEVLEVSNGKPVLFFPARFDVPEVQMLDGYAYWLAVQCYNRASGKQMRPSASTDAQSAWWGGRGGGTVPHALIACFLGDTVEAMVNYARYLPPDIPRVALVDFNNDTAGAAQATAAAFWEEYRAAYKTGNTESQRRWTLDGVRLDTSKNLQDASLAPDGPYGVNPDLVYKVRSALDRAWESWDVPPALAEVAQQFCRSIRIIVSGGFDRARIQQYEADGVPVDVYGVGSTLLQNDSATNTDYSMDIVRVQIDGRWVVMAKAGRQPCDNVNLKNVDLREVE